LPSEVGTSSSGEGPRDEPDDESLVRSKLGGIVMLGDKYEVQAGGLRILGRESRILDICPIVDSYID
jgi:hypothetical protein